MKILRKKGATSQILQIFIQDSSSTVGAGLTGLAFNTSSLTAYYHRDTDTTATAITLVTMTVGTFTSSGFKEIDSTNMPGWYQFCPPDACFASGASSVILYLKGAANMAPLPIEVDLAGQVDVTTWLGGAIPSPNVTGVPLIDAKYLLGTVLATPAVAGLMDVNVKNYNNHTAVTDGNNYPSVNIVDVAGSALSTSSAQFGVNVVNWRGSAVPATDTAGCPKLSAYDSALIASGTASAGGASTITLGTALGADSIVVGCVVEILSGTGAKQVRSISAYVDSTQVLTVNSPWTTNPDNTSVYAIKVATAASDPSLVVTGTAAAGGASTITLAAALGADSLPVGCTISITGGTGGNQTRGITGYVNSTKVVTVDRAWTTNPDNTSVYVLRQASAPALNSSLQVTAASVQGNVTGSVASVTGRVTANTDQWAGDTIPSPNVTGVPKVDIVDCGGSAVAVGAIPNVAAGSSGGLPVLNSSGNVTADIQTIKTQTVTCAAGVTVNVNVGTTQPVNFTGTAGAALVKSDMVDVAGAAVSASAAQIGVNLVNVSGSALSTSTAQIGVNVVNFGGSAGTFASGKPAVTVASTDVTGNVAADVQTIKTQAVACAAPVAVGAFVGNASAALSVDGSGRVDVGKTLGTAVTLDSNNVLNVSAKYLAGTTLTARDIGASVLLSTGTGTGQLDFTSGVVKCNNVQWLGGVIPAVNTTGVPLVDAKYMTGTLLTARDIGASVLLSAGTGAGQLDFTSGVVKCNATQWLGGTIPQVNVTGVPLVDAKYLLGTIFATPSTNGIPDVNLKNIAGSAVSTSTAQLGVNVVGFGGTTGTFSSGKPAVTLLSTDVSGNIGVDLQTIKTQAIACAAPITVGAYVGNATAALAVDASGRVDVGKILGTASAGAAGYVGIDWAHVNAPTTTVGLTGTTVSSSQVAASVTASVTVGAIGAGVITSSAFTFTDNVSGPATGILERINQVWRRFLKKVVKDSVGGTIKTYSDANATLTTQTVTSSAGVDTVGAAS